MRVLPYGERALLVELAEGDVLALRAALLTGRGLPRREALGELVPGARTLLVPFDPIRTSAGEVTAAIMATEVAHVAPLRPAEVVELPVRYDGPDLAAVAEQVGCTVDAVIARHTDAEYVVAFCGFAPGFAYLRGLHPSLHLPRLSRPRVSVAAGSVGIAGEFTAAYPRSSPGGWNLLGRTSTTLWDLTREPPAQLTPGVRVRFVAS